MNKGEISDLVPVELINLLKKDFVASGSNNIQAGNSVQPIPILLPDLD